MNNVMLDIETVGNGSNAAIISIGAVFFDPHNGGLGDTFYSVINLKSAAHYGEIDAGSVMWWMKQSEEARAIFNDDKAESIKDALTEFTTFMAKVPEFKDRHVWGNGCTFDNVIVGNAFKKTCISQPWHYSGDRDVRTIVDLGRNILGIDPKYKMKREGVAHNALDDAIHQAKYVSEIYSKLKQPFAEVKA